MTISDYRENLQNGINVLQSEELMNNRIRELFPNSNGTAKLEGKSFHFTGLTIEQIDELMTKIIQG